MRKYIYKLIVILFVITFLFSSTGCLEEGMKAGEKVYEVLYTFITDFFPIESKPEKASTEVAKVETPEPVTEETPVEEAEPTVKETEPEKIETPEAVIEPEKTVIIESGPTQASGDFNIETFRNGRPLERALNVPEKYKKDKATLVSYLISGIDNDFEKAKVLHDWIALNIAYDTEGYFSGEIEAYDSESAFKSGKAVCAGYSSLYEELCTMAGLHCITISGVSKGYSYSTKGEFGAHAWNGVELYGNWYLIDSTWDSGHIEGKSFVRDYNTNYLFSSPAAFIYTHFPDEKGWQLLSKPLSEEDFGKLVFARGRFFGMGLSIVSPYTFKNNVTEEFEVRVKAPENVLIISSLRSGENEYKDYTFTQKNGDEYIIKSHFPFENKEYDLMVFAKYREDEGLYNDVLLYKVMAGEKSSSFPLIYSTFTEHNCFLYEPLNSNITRGKMTDFKIYVEGAEEVAIVINKDFTSLKKSGNICYEGSVKITGADTFTINARFPGDSQYWGLAEYKISP